MTSGHSIQRMKDRSERALNDGIGVNAATLSERPPLPSVSRWASNADIFMGAAETHDTLPAGLYRLSENIHGEPQFLKQKHDTDGLIELPDSEAQSILSEFDTFWARRAEFQKRGFLQKRGFALWGPPGSGKTSTINLLVKRLIRDQAGIVIFIQNPSTAARCLRMLRMIEPDRPVIALLEDLDALVENYGESEYLALLDGEAQVDRICFVATTNYPEKLDRRFFDRPSRFDTIKYIDMPEASARRAFLLAKEPDMEQGERDKWVAATDGFSMAHLKELVIAVKCLGQTFESALERLESMRVRRPSSEDEPTRRRIGLIRSTYMEAGAKS